MRAPVPVTLSLVTILLACQDQSGTLAPEETSAVRAPATASFSTASQIAQLRRLVARFHDFDAAVAAGWSAQITPCWMDTDLPSQPGTGGMGFHYGNLEYILDGGAVNLLEPELLLYEPEKNGKLRFVGVDYIVRYADHPETADPPTLLGQKFSKVPEVGVWGLHIWVGRENASGIFEPWNEKVSCEFAAGATAAGHHHGG
ncbi:MAG TPA: hypothetical protein VFG66_01535 [Gemmatimonadales bacterium]|nr:hypothetical protein [Gemmatimonadales bacterium]